MFVSETKVRVRYGETDKMGVVYNGNYALYFEIGRTEALREIGITYHSIEESGVMMPVHSMSMLFKKPAYYDDELTIKTIFKTRPTVKTEIFYEIVNAKNELVCTGETVLVFVDMKTNKPVRCPANIFQTFSKLIPE